MPLPASPSHPFRNIASGGAAVRPHEPITAFVDVAVIPMDRERVLAHQTVLVRGDRIVALGPAKQVAVPAEAVRVDGRGKYLIPGLADMHVHLRQDSEKSLLLFVANGVTTIRDMHSGNREGVGQDGKDSTRLAFRRRIAAGELLGPRIYLAGDPAEASAAAAAQTVAELKADGHDFVKISLRDNGPPDAYDSIKAAANRVGLRMVGHVPGGRSLEGVLQDHWASIEHLTGYYEAVLGYSPDGIFGKFQQLAQVIDTLSWMQPTFHPTAKLQAVARATQRAGVWNCPTIKQWLVLLPRDSSAEALLHPDAAPRAKSDEGSPVMQAVRRVGRRMQEFNYWMVKALQEAGAGMLLGTDIGDYSLTDVPPGFGVVTELRELVNAGLTPYQALATGTRNVAAFLGTLDSAGTVTVGKRADLVLLEGNPLRDIGYAAGAAGVMVGGRWLARADLDARLDSLQSWQGFDLKGARQAMWTRRPPKTP